jgi:tRNA nucleotidyltransferase (CCA-adding enzyme)
VTGANVLEALAVQPGGPQLLQLAGARDDVALVGGAVRDLMLGRNPRELDVVVGGDAEPLARELATILGANITLHDRFGTAVVEWEAGRVDIARRRAESYPAAGALPEVRPGTVDEDLRRRDFTVNALAVALGGPRAGGLDAAEHALEDLEAGRLRVLHERSFEDDPTRLLRLARYRTRLGFELEPHTAQLAADAIRAGAVASVSRARLGTELRLALGEADALDALATLDDLGVLAALHPRLRFDADLAGAALGLLAHAAGEDPQKRPDLLLLAVLLIPMAIDLSEGWERDMYTLLNDLEFPAADRDRAIHDAIGIEVVAYELDRTEAPSQVYEAAAHVSAEGVALAGAWADLRSSSGAASEAAREWLSQIRGVSLLISGEDLLAAGIPEGPQIGLRLEAVLLRKLDGELADGREAELDAAVKARV